MPSTILITYTACHHAIPAQNLPARDVKQEIEKAANGEVCPRCRAEAGMEASENA